MDSPDATFAGDRGLLVPTPTSPMRPERRSEPFNAPLTVQSPMPLATIARADEIAVPASPGTFTSHPREAPPSALSLQNQLGHPAKSYIVRFDCLDRITHNEYTATITRDHNRPINV